MTSPTPTPVVATEREAFEAAVKSLPAFRPHELYRRDFPGSDRIGEYVEYATEHAWRLWQARASLPSIPQGAAADLVDPAVPGSEFPDAADVGRAIQRAARALSDRWAAMCNVDREDHWKYHSEDCFDEIRLVVAAMKDQA